MRKKSTVVENLDQYTIFDEPRSGTDLMPRAKYLEFVDGEVTEANKHKGAAELSATVAEELGLNRWDNADAYNLHLDRAEGHLGRACGKCAIRGCELRGDIEKWAKKHPYAGERHRLIIRAQKQAKQGIETSC
jgi:hypothetical protein